MRRVTRAGRVYVTGPDPITGRDMVRMDSVTLQHLADALFPDLDPVLGTDLRAFAQVIDAGHGASDDYGVARHRADITDGVSGLPRSIAREVRLHAVYGAETNEHGEYVTGGHRSASGLARRPDRFSTRRTLVRRTDGRIGSHTMARRSGDPGADVRDASGALMYRAVIVGNVTRIVSWSDDPSYVWVGHDYRSRPRVKSTSIARTERRAGRGVRATREVTPEESAIVDALAGGSDEVTVTFPDVTVTIVQHDASPMSVTMVRGSERVTFRARTAAVIARRVTA